MDDKIENNEKKIRKLEEVAINYIKNSQKLTTKTLQEIASIVMGQSPAGSTLNDKYGMIFYQGRTDFGLRYPTIRIYTTEPTRKANVDDILLSVRAPVGDVNITLYNCCIGRGLAYIRSQNYQNVLFYILKLNKSNFNIYNGEGTVFGSIDKKALYNFKIDIPINCKDLELMCKIINDKCKNLHYQNMHLHKLKQLYLKKFFG